MNFQREKFALAGGITLALNLIENAVSRSQEASHLLHHFFILPASRIVQLTTELPGVTGYFCIEDTRKNKYLPAKRLDFPGMSAYFTRSKTREARVLRSEIVRDHHNPWQSSLQEL